MKKFATHIQRFMPFIVVTGIISLFLAGTSLFNIDGLPGDEALIPGLVLFCWACMLYCFARLFISVPARPARGAGLKLRFAVALRRGLLWLFAIAALTLSLALVVLSYELIRVWLTS
ncbi:MAG: hypothetical protein QGG67_15490 [Gammaproteobacteria bacterium]|nr:hypothetical protein [Gammaproteobacteria bacterium]